MSGDTSIEWTDKSWNPIRGCSRVSEGCERCYAEQIAARFSGEGQAYEGLAYRNESGAHWTGKVRLVEEHLQDPLKWKRPRRIFVNSMSDCFHKDVAFDWLVQIWHVMREAHWHAYQILTKRADVMLTQVPRVMAKLNINEPLPNVWLGVSCEDQKTADERIPLLLKTPAAVRFISAEPLLSEIDLSKYLGLRRSMANRWFTIPDSATGRLDWVIVGGESGPHARECNLDWLRSIVQQCEAAGVPCFVKQLGSVPVWNGCGLVANNPKCLTSENFGGGLLRLHPSDRKGGKIEEFPEDLRVRQFPIEQHSRIASPCAPHSKR